MVEVTEEMSVEEVLVLRKREEVKEQSEKEKRRKTGWRRRSQ